MDAHEFFNIDIPKKKKNFWCTIGLHNYKYSNSTDFNKRGKGQTSFLAWTEIYICKNCEKELKERCV